MQSILGACIVKGVLKLSALSRLGTRRAAVFILGFIQNLPRVFIEEPGPSPASSKPKPIPETFF